MFVVLCDFDVAIVEYILITAYGRSPGALLRVIRLSGFFRGLGILLIRVLRGLFVCHELMHDWFLFLLLIHS